MQSPLRKFRQNSIVFEKLGYLSEKLWRVAATVEFNIFYWNFAHLSYLPVSTKSYSGFFYLV